MQRLRAEKMKLKMTSRKNIIRLDTHQCVGGQIQWRIKDRNTNTDQNLMLGWKNAERSSIGIPQPAAASLRSWVFARNLGFKISKNWAFGKSLDSMNFPPNLHWSNVLISVWFLDFLGRLIIFLSYVLNQTDLVGKEKIYYERSLSGLRGKCVLPTLMYCTAKLFYL